MEVSPFCAATISKPRFVGSPVAEDFVGESLLYLAGHADPPGRSSSLRRNPSATGLPTKRGWKLSQRKTATTSIFEDPAAHHKPAATRTLTAAAAGLPRRHGLQTSRLGRPTPRRRPRQTRRSRLRPRRHRDARQARHKLEANQPLVTLFAEDPELLNEPEAMLRETLQISQTPPKLQPSSAKSLQRSICGPSPSATKSRTSLSTKTEKDPETKVPSPSPH